MQELGLKGTELNLFAILYGYSQEEDGCYYGTRATLAKRCGVSSTRTIDSAMDSLMEKGLVKKRVAQYEGQPIITYTTCAKSAQGCAKIAQGIPQNLQGGCAKIAHKNNKEEKEIVKENIPPTPQAVADYVRGRGFADPEGFADYFIEICTNNGWRQGNGNGNPVTNWKNYIVSAWERNHKNKTYPRAAAPAPISTINTNNLKDYLK